MGLPSLDLSFMGTVWPRQHLNDEYRVLCKEIAIALFHQHSGVLVPVSFNHLAISSINRRM